MILVSHMAQCSLLSSKPQHLPIAPACTLLFFQAEAKGSQHSKETMKTG